MPFPLYIALRYLRSKSNQNAVNVINFITFLVIVIGSAALFIVLSAFAGLKTFSLQFANAADPDVKITPTTGKFFSISPTQEAQLYKLNGIAFYTKELEERVYLTHRKKSHIAYIKGVDSVFTKVTAMDTTLYFGNWDLQHQQGVAGLGIANLLGLTINDYRYPLEILVPKPGEGFLKQQSLQSKPYNSFPIVISGIYAIEDELDKKYVFTELPLVQALLEKDSTMVSGIAIKLNENAKLTYLKERISAIFNNQVTLKNREQQNSTLYKMLNTENLATYLIFTLVLIIAMFNVVGAIIMMILDKKLQCKTLYSFGVTLGQLRMIYFLQGVVVTAVGGIVGIALASLLIGSQLAFGWLKISASITYPVAFSFSNVGVVLGTIIVLGLIASGIASRGVSMKLIKE